MLTAWCCTDILSSSTLVISGRSKLFFLLWSFLLSFLCVFLFSLFLRTCIFCFVNYFLVICFMLNSFFFFFAPHERCLLQVGMFFMGVQPTSEVTIVEVLRFVVGHLVFRVLGLENRCFISDPILIRWRLLVCEGCKGRKRRRRWEIPFKFELYPFWISTFFCLGFHMVTKLWGISSRSTWKQSFLPNTELKYTSRFLWLIGLKFNWTFLNFSLISLCLRVSTHNIPCYF